MLPVHIGEVNGLMKESKEGTIILPRCLLLKSLTTPSKDKT